MPVGGVASFTVTLGPDKSLIAPKGQSPTPPQTVLRLSTTTPPQKTPPGGTPTPQHSGGHDPAGTFTADNPSRHTTRHATAVRVCPYGIQLQTGDTTSHPRHDRTWIQPRRRRPLTTAHRGLNSNMTTAYSIAFLPGHLHRGVPLAIRRSSSLKTRHADPIQFKDLTSRRCRNRANITTNANF